MRQVFIATMAILASVLAGPAGGDAPTVTLTFPGQQPAEFTTASGDRFIAALESQEDADGHAIVVSLALRPAGEPSSRNMLEPPGDWHGLQFFDFAPADCAAPVGGVFGPARTFLLPARHANFVTRLIDCTAHDGVITHLTVTVRLEPAP